jgi:hypothetical protein
MSLFANLTNGRCPGCDTELFDTTYRRRMVRFIVIVAAVAVLAGAAASVAVSMRARQPQPLAPSSPSQP